MKKKLCILCGEQLENEWGNNPSPVSEVGRCCSYCNTTKVIPARLQQAGILVEIKKNN